MQFPAAPPKTHQQLLVLFCFTSLIGMLIIIAATP